MPHESSTISSFILNRSSILFSILSRRLLNIKACCQHDNESAFIVCVCVLWFFSTKFFWRPMLLNLELVATKAILWLGNNATSSMTPVRLTTTLRAICNHNHNHWNSKKPGAVYLFMNAIVAVSLLGTIESLDFRSKKVLLGSDHSIKFSKPPPSLSPAYSWSGQAPISGHPGHDFAAHYVLTDWNLTSWILGSEARTKTGLLSIT